MIKKIFLTFLFVLSLGAALSAALTEKNFNQDMAYYSRTAKTKNLSANDRLYVLERLREKYKESDFDLSPLFAEIDRWYGARLKDGKSVPAEAKPTTPETAPMGNLTKVLVSEGADFTRLVLDVSGDPEFRDEIKKDDRGFNPPVLLIYLYHTKESLKPFSKNFAVKRGFIRQVQTQTISKKPSTVKVSVALREDRPYQVTKLNGQLVLTVEKGPLGDPAQAAEIPAAPSASAPTETPASVSAVQISSPISVTIIGAVKTQGPLQISAGTKLLEAIVLAGGFEANARTDRVRVVRKDQGKKVTQEYNLSEVLKKDPSRDIVLKPGDLVIVPEKSAVKQTLLNGKIVPWATFFISIGLVLALLI